MNAKRPGHADGELDTSKTDSQQLLSATQNGKKASVSNSTVPHMFQPKVSSASCKGQHTSVSRLASASANNGGHSSQARLSSASACYGEHTSLSRLVPAAACNGGDTSQSRTVSTSVFNGRHISQSRFVPSSLSNRGNTSQAWLASSSVSNGGHTSQSSALASNGEDTSQASVSGSNGELISQARLFSDLNGNGGDNSQASVSATNGENISQASLAAASDSNGRNNSQASANEEHASQAMPSSSSASIEGYSSQAKLASSSNSDGGDTSQVGLISATASNEDNMSHKSRAASVSNVHSDTDKTDKFHRDSITEDDYEPDMVFHPVPLTLQEGVVHSLHDMTVVSPDSYCSAQDDSSSPCLSPVIPDSLNSSVEDVQSRNDVETVKVKISEENNEQHLEDYEECSLNEAPLVELDPVPISRHSSSKAKLVGILKKKSESSYKVHPFPHSSHFHSPSYPKNGLTGVIGLGYGKMKAPDSTRKVRFSDEVGTNIKVLSPIANYANSSQTPLWRTPLPSDDSAASLPSSGFAHKIKWSLSSKADAISQGKPLEMQKPDIPSAPPVTVREDFIADSISKPLNPTTADEFTTDSSTLTADVENGKVTEQHQSLEKTPTDEDIDSMWTQIHECIHSTKKPTVPRKTFSFRQTTVNGKH